MFRLSMVALLSDSHFYTSLKLRESKQRVAKLGEELGYIEIEDRTKVPRPGPGKHRTDSLRWRVLIPKGNKYASRMASENIPRNGVPVDGTSGISNENYAAKDSEVLITAALHQRPNGMGELVVTPRIAVSYEQMDGASHRIAASSMEWRETTPGQERTVLGENTTAILDPAGSIELLKVRALERQPNGNFGPSIKSMPGIAVWLERH